MRAAARPRKQAWPRARRVAVRALCFLALGAVANVAVCFALALLVDVSLGPTQSAEAWTGQDVWTVTRWNRTGATYILSSRDASRDWSPGQATGAPNSPGGGDRVTAWASASSDAQEEWLLLEYAEAVVPSAVRVYETCATGALTKVTAYTEGGAEVEAWAGVDPTPTGAIIGTSQVPLKTRFPTRKLKLYFDSARVPGWNEVDAVALVAADGREAWARRAQASSTYATRSMATVASGEVSVLAPKWSGLDQPLDAPESVGSEQRAVEARGWPMLALWGKVGATRQPTSAGGTGRGGALLTGSGTVYLTGGLMTLGGGAAAPASPLAPVSGQAALPLRPIWPGFVANSVLYAVVLFLSYWALTVPRRFVREVSRLRRGCCVTCGYDLGFDFVPGCPECGWRRGAALAARRSVTELH